MNPVYPLYIVSKGRPACITARELSKMKVPFKIVVEPQDVESYSTLWESYLLVLPFENLGQGSIPARNWIWEHSIQEGHEKHWILDDNIEGFHRLHENEKFKVTSGTIFRIAEIFSDRYENLALSGFNYYSFCKKTDKLPPYYANTRIYSCILIRNDIPYRWRGRYNEDTDLSIRVLKDGWCTVLFNAFLCGKVTTQRMKGGNTDNVYTDKDQRKKFAMSLVNQHPDVVKLTWRFNRWHHLVNYKLFKSNLLKFKAGISLKDEPNNYGMRLV